MDESRVTMESTQVVRSIVLNIEGKEFKYRSVDEIPAEHRALWEQVQAIMAARQKSGNPNAKGTETIGGLPVSVETRQRHTFTLSLDGQEFHYNSVEEMPPEHRSMWEAMQPVRDQIQVSGRKSATFIGDEEGMCEVVDEVLDTRFRDRIKRRLVPVPGWGKSRETVMCTQCRRRVTPKKGWFGRRKCPECGARLVTD